MDIVSDTSGYEDWLAGFGPLHAPDLALKHARMSDPVDPFPFFRGTYYRWLRHWPEICPTLLDAPLVLAVGDLHVENYGTWRDADGRLCWGVNDFDEADDLPYSFDLVRLAASVRFAKRAGTLPTKLGDACATILDGYRSCLADSGRPFVLEEQHPHLRAAAMAADRDPPQFWTKLTKLLADPPAEPPLEARAALLQALPDPHLTPAYRFRPGVGMGSLGKPRYVALVEWAGGWVCRETKTVTPPTTSRAKGELGAKSRMAEAVGRAIRAADPFYRPGAAWVVRRLAPRCSRIELASLAEGDVGRVLHGMGAEVANVHLGTARIGPELLRDLTSRKAGWLEPAARAMADAIERDWIEWRTATRSK